MKQLLLLSLYRVVLLSFCSLQISASLLCNDVFGRLYYFDDTVDFDYKLKKGKLKNRNAIRILEINDYPTEIIDEALAISKQLDNAN